MPTNYNTFDHDHNISIHYILNTTWQFFMARFQIQHYFLLQFDIYTHSDTVGLIAARNNRSHDRHNSCIWPLVFSIIIICMYCIHNIQFYFFLVLIYSIIPCNTSVFYRPHLYYYLYYHLYYYLYYYFLFQYYSICLFYASIVGYNNHD